MTISTEAFQAQCFPWEKGASFAMDSNSTDLVPAQKDMQLTEAHGKA